LKYGVLWCPHDDCDETLIEEAIYRRYVEILWYTSEKFESKWKPNLYYVCNVWNLKKTLQYNVRCSLDGDAAQKRNITSSIRGDTSIVVHIIQKWCKFQSKTFK